ncbi:MAG: DUF3467 domain-containing protein [Streptosporangiaceae bacterium]
MSEEPAAPPRWTGDSPRSYANVVAINGGPFDVMLVFGVQEARMGSGDQTLEEVARISMSWGHAKSMIPLLAKMVADYESKYGEVPAPGFEDNWRA